MITKINEKFELVALEIELLKTCFTDSGFFQRFVTITIPLLRKIFSNYIQTWELDLLSDRKIIDANTELTNAFFSIWENVKIRQDTKTKKQLIDLLRLIRGPRFEFMSSLLYRVFPRLRELYVTQVSIPAEFPFAHTAQKIISYMSCEKELIQSVNLNYIRCSYFQTCFDDSSNKIRIVKRDLRNTNYHMDLMRIINKRKRKKEIRQREYTYFPFQKIKCEKVKLFAPTAKELYLYSTSQFTSDQQSHPKLIWLSFQTLEESWSYRNENILKIRWSRLRGESNEIGLLAHNQYNKFLLIASAEEFKTLDKPNYKGVIFKREECLNLLSRLFLELKKTVILPDNANVKKSISNDLKVPKEDSDEYIFCEWYSDWCEKNKSKSAALRTQNKAISDFKKSQIKLKKNYQESTFKTWIINFRKRRKAQLGKSISPLVKSQMD